MGLELLIFGFFVRWLGMKGLKRFDGSKLVFLELLLIDYFF